MGFVLRVFVCFFLWRTAKAMTGSVTFQEALKLRLDIIKPTISQVKDFIKTKPPTLTPGIK